MRWRQKHFDDFKHLIYMKNDNLAILKAPSGETCISLILPFFQQGKPIGENPVLVKYAIKETKAILDVKEGIDQETKSMLIDKLEKLTGTIDFMHRAEAVGLFVSENVSEKYLFEFPVKKSITVNKHFDIRPVLLEQWETEPYAFLMITATKAKLFNGMGRKLKEVFQRDFPKEFTDTFEYPRPAPAGQESSSLKGAEEKSVTRENRLKEFYSSVADDLKIHAGRNVPLFLAGLADETSLFSKITGIKISANLTGNYEYDSLIELGEKAYKLLKGYHHKKVEDIIRMLRESGGAPMASTGIEGAWDDISNGNARILLVDKDIVVPAYQTDDQTSVSLAPDSHHTRYLDDAINDLLWLAMQKDCQVVFTDNGELDPFDKVAVLHRYKEVVE
jgi:hypothetical protein